MSFLATVKQYWYVPVLTVVLLTAIGIGMSLFIPQRYESNLSMLVIQQQKGRFDAYTAARSAQTVSETLVNVLHTSSVQEAVLTNEGFGVDEEAFPRDPSLRSAFWESTVQARTANADGTIHIRVLHEERSQARAIAFSVANTLIETGGQYHGGGQDIVIRMIDEPTTSLGVVEPNIVRNGVAAAVLGLLVGVGFLVLLEGRASPLIGMRSRISTQTYTPSQAGASSGEQSVNLSARPGLTYGEELPSYNVELAHVEVMPTADASSGAFAVSEQEVVAPEATVPEGMPQQEETEGMETQQEVVVNAPTESVRSETPAAPVVADAEEEEDDLFEIPAGIDEEEEQVEEKEQSNKSAQSQVEQEVGERESIRKENASAAAGWGEGATKPLERLLKRSRSRAATTADSQRTTSASPLQKGEGEKGSDASRTQKEQEAPKKVATVSDLPPSARVAPVAAATSASKKRSKKKAKKSVRKPSIASTTSQDKQEEQPVASFKGGLQELRRQMEERKKERETKMQFTGNPIQQAFSKEETPAPSTLKTGVAPRTTVSQAAASKGSFAEKMQKKLEERQAQKSSGAEEKEPEPLMDVASTEEWMRTGSFNKSEV